MHVYAACNFFQANQHVHVSLKEFRECDCNLEIAHESTFLDEESPPTHNIMTRNQKQTTTSDDMLHDASDFTYMVAQAIAFDTPKKGGLEKHAPEARKISGTCQWKVLEHNVVPWIHLSVFAVFKHSSLGLFEAIVGIRRKGEGDG
jgi:hypothetical protein